MLNKNYNAILFGLGSIGAGSGIYNKKWNNHLDSLKRASWIENIYIFDPFVDVKGFINKNIFDFLNLNIPNDNLFYLLMLVQRQEEYIGFPGYMIYAILIYV